MTGGRRLRLGQLPARTLAGLPVVLPGLFAAAILLPCCGVFVQKFTKEARPLSYVGKVTFGAPLSEEGCIVIPLTYSGGRWHQNSAVVPCSVESSVGETTIDMTVITALVTEHPDDGNGYRLVLPPETRGWFKVYYRDPDATRHEIGALEIGN